ncbi:DUF4281 domain-containing protein [Synechococcales cyanobacterium C]|uniref:DUF4281 domain-containing protein n=1 Tax=Petrachloros mirabilis ULC683 TaxID=2781853 RepID=A0A8K2A7H2_9CYAN|nr:ABA4-like family protein [Petrachloros mirabilis]NCJ05960.1 DUF4281 domain-containing protein [Petrachloros mirabilis ULC683]
MTAELWFTLANIFVLPFWSLMILLPNWQWTRRILSSYLPFVALALLYVGFLISAITPESAQALANPKLADIARFFGDESAAATGWVHFLVMDLFVGRWIYWEGQRTGIWTVHSLVLCLFAGPLGLLTHVVTAAITERFFPPEQPKTSPDAVKSTAPSNP